MVSMQSLNIFVCNMATMYIVEVMRKHIANEISQKNSTEICQFYSREKSLYIAWACVIVLGTW